MTRPWFVFLCCFALGATVVIGVIAVTHPRRSDPLAQEMRRIAAQVERSEAPTERE